MATITQDMRFRLSLIRYAQKHGVSKAAVRYRVNRQYVYRWKKRYDGSWESLRNRSRRPHNHPNQHTPAELKLISDMRRRNPDAGLVVFWVKLHAARVQALDYRPLSRPQAARGHGCQAAKPQVRPQAIRTDALSRAEVPNGCKIRPCCLPGQ